jgi:hypothetical protein
MENPFRFTAARTKTALVIAFPPDMRGLFNPEIHALVREVEARLEDVYVTYALTSGFGPSLRDAMAAARFNGCDSAVVVPAGDHDADRFKTRESIGDWMLTASPFSSDLDAPTLARAYLSAIEEAGRAA